MYFMSVNMLAVLVAGVATMVLGFVWYSPILFAKPWMREMGYDPNDKEKMKEMQKGAGMTYGLSFVASLLSAFVLAKVLGLRPLEGALYGIKIGVAVWAGFVATVQLTSALFTKNSAKLFFINTGYQLVCYVAMGVILAVWK